MIDSAGCREIVRTYAKHGWLLRRVLLTKEFRESLGDDLSELVGDADVSFNSTIDAAWFSRQPGKGEIAWELRMLSETPFALLDYADENAGDFEDKIRELESRLAKTAAAKRNA